MSRTGHPIHHILFAAAAGHPPSAADLDAVAALAGDVMPGAELRQRVQEAAAAVSDLRRDGEQGRAREQAGVAFRALTNKLPAPKKTSRAEGVTDPAELARLVGRGGHQPTI